MAYERGHPPLARLTGETAAQFLDRISAGATLVVIAENMNSIFERIGNEGQQALRAYVNNGGRLVIIGTSPTLFGGVTSQADPFYGAFSITRLDEFTIDQAQELLQRIARLRGDLLLEQELGTERSRNRLAVIGQLAGGHPRLWMLFADCTSVESLDELVPMFLKAMDDLTPYYQARISELGGQQDQIVAFLCAAGGARTVAQIALECGIPAKSTAVQLAKLVETGFVRLVELAGLEHSGDRRKTFYELRDPLMRLCLDVKVSRGESLRLVVEFLRAWFDSLSLSMTVETNGLEIWAGKLVDTVEYRIATAVLAWRADHDRSHLLQLAVEERAVALTLVGLTCSPAGAV